MSFPDYTLRRATLDDAPAMGQLVYRAFTEFNLSVGIPPSMDFESVEYGVAVMRRNLQLQSTYAVVAVNDATGKLLGGALLRYSGQGAHSIGPVFVDPDYSNSGVATRIMRSLLEKAKETNGAKSVRLLQVAANTKSFCLYAKLGFHAVEMVSLFEGRVEEEKSTRVCSELGIKLASNEDGGVAQIRQMQEADVPVCASLFKIAMGYDRELELKDHLLLKPECAWIAHDRSGWLVI